jgi:hypothetical protein
MPELRLALPAVAVSGGLVVGTFTEGASLSGSMDAIGALLAWYLMWRFRPTSEPNSFVCGISQNGPGQ